MVTFVGSVGMGIGAVGVRGEVKSCKDRGTGRAGTLVALEEEAGPVVLASEDASDTDR